MFHCYNNQATPVEIKPINIKINSNKNKYLQQYSLNHTFFDPSRSSPPNQFISILQERLEKMEVKRNNE